MGPYFVEVEDEASVPYISILGLVFGSNESCGRFNGLSLIESVESRWLFSHAKHEHFQYRGDEVRNCKTHGLGLGLNDLILRINHAVSSAAYFQSAFVNNCVTISRIQNHRTLRMEC